MQPGSRLGPYEILARIGAGGMGEVWRARDTRLGREVAIKILPAEFADDARLKIRFEREARTISQLSHPNICTLHDVGDGYIVMELLEGETLSYRLARGPLPLPEVIRYGVQIAEALGRAHRQGVVHRDVKPGNVMITKGGAKLLDFGLAKSSGATASSSDETATMQKPVTEEGTVVGTYQYMAPEQLAGEEPDARTDIFALGAVLYEMTTGKRAFEGKNRTGVVSAIISGEPRAMQELQPLTPPALEHVILKCLEKDPEDRWQSASDIAEELRWISQAGSQAGAAPLAIKRRRWRAALMIGAVALLAGALADRLLVRSFPAVSSAPVVRSTIEVEPGHWLFGMHWRLEAARPSRTAMAISSDGRFVVYSAIEENAPPQSKPRLFLRRLDGSKAEPIAGTEGGLSPFLSPDDRWVGFWADGTLRKIPVGGGLPVVLCDVPWLAGADWGRDDSIVFSGHWETGLSRIRGAGGNPEALTTPDPKREENGHRLPSWLPEGKGILFTVMGHPWDPRPRLALLRTDTLQWTVLLEDAADGRYVPTGHIVFMRQGTLMAVRFDTARKEIAGQPAPVVEDVAQAYSIYAGVHTCAGQFGFSDSGTLVYAEGGIAPDPANSLVWVSMEGVEEPVTDLRRPAFAPRLSPDGRRIVYMSLGNRESQSWVYDLVTGTNSRLTEEGHPLGAIWSPDGKRLLHGSLKALAHNLYLQPYDGSAPMERVMTSEYSQFVGSWSSDGRTAAVAEWNARTSADIHLLDISSGVVTPFLVSKFHEGYPDFSPDGRWLAYSSNESGRREVYVQPIPGPGAKHLVSTRGGEDPLWARDGRQLFYRWQGEVWAADVRTDGGFSTGKPRLLFDRPGYHRGDPNRTWDISLDSQRFLMTRIEKGDPMPITKMTLVQGWFQELERILPPGGR
jgi:eukaryotic-like serine/threonine-protein kinase